MVGWHHRLKGRESEQTSGVGDGQGGLASCSPWGRRESDTTEPLNNCSTAVDRGVMSAAVMAQPASPRPPLSAVGLALHSPPHPEGPFQVEL